MAITLAVGNCGVNYVIGIFSGECRGALSTAEYQSLDNRVRVDDPRGEYYDS
jgi:hypothetical protein